jgi:hypothetical protein
MHVQLTSCLHLQHLHTHAVHTSTCAWLVVQGGGGGAGLDSSIFQSYLTACKGYDSFSDDDDEGAR